MTTLTAKEALAQGYRYCGGKYQENLEDLSEIEEDYLKSELGLGNVYFLYSKEPKTLSVSMSYDIFESIIENSDLCEADWDTMPKELNDEFGKELQALLDKIGERKTNTYERTEHTLVLPKPVNNPNQ